MGEFTLSSSVIDLFGGEKAVKGEEVFSWSILKKVK